MRDEARYECESVGNVVCRGCEGEGESLIQGSNVFLLSTDWESIIAGVHCLTFLQRQLWFSCSHCSWSTVLEKYLLSDSEETREVRRSMSRKEQRNSGLQTLSVKSM